MSTTDDRRNPNVSRVPLATLVDICSQESELGPFQAESFNVSGRGMHVRTSHLPEIGESLVCRFEHNGHEILAEGAVAWRSESEEGGEFGLQFTALDADSSEVLREIGRSRSCAPPARETSLAAFDDDEDEETLVLSAGHRVKLHIDGLGAPMKASVQSGSERKVRVGSNLEFLKVGRKLELEALDGGERRGATIDSVNVVLNPSTSVPELVVHLRYEGFSPTPAPVGVAAKGAARSPGIDYEDEAFAGGALDDEEEAAPWKPAADVLTARLGHALDGAQSAARKAGGLMSRAFKSAKAQADAKGMTTFPKLPISFSSGDSEAPSARLRSQTKRTHRGAPSHLRSGIHELGLTGKTAQRSRSKVAQPVSPRASLGNLREKLGRGAVFGGALVVVVGSAALLRGFSDDEPEGVVAQADVAGKAAEDGAADAAATGDAATAPAQPAAAPEPSHPDGIVADVPLFGARAVAPEAEEEGVAQEADSGDTISDAAAEKLAAAAAVQDESWDDEASPKETATNEAWGRGRLHLPTVHRIRLDGEGKELSGVMDPTGFTVVVTGRKAMESGRSIEKRDKRIGQVKASNAAEGARIRFSFRGPVPAYRVRLRNDFVEFLVSAPQDGVAQL